MGVDHVAYGNGGGPRDPVESRPLPTPEEAQALVSATEAPTEQARVSLATQQQAWGASPGMTDEQWAALERDRIAQAEAAADRLFARPGLLRDEAGMPIPVADPQNDPYGDIQGRQVSASDYRVDRKLESSSCRSRRSPMVATIRATEA